MMLAHFEVAIRAIFEELNIFWLCSNGLIETIYGKIVLLLFVITATETILNCWILFYNRLFCHINVILYNQALLMLFNCFTRFEIFDCLNDQTILKLGGCHVKHSYRTGGINLNGFGKVLDGQLVVAQILIH